MTDSRSSRLQSPVTRVRSPCVDICALGDDDLCIGCFRHATEIAGWSRYTEDEKREVLKRVAEREKKQLLG